MFLLAQLLKLNYMWPKNVFTKYIFVFYKSFCRQELHFLFVNAPNFMITTVKMQNSKQNKKEH